MTLPFVLSVVDFADEEYKKSRIGYGNIHTIKKLSKLVEQVDTITGTKTYSNLPKLSMAYDKHLIERPPVV